MKNYGKIRVDEEILNSFIFYFMLSLYLTSRGISEQVATTSLRSFIADCRKDGIFRTPEAEATYYDTAYKCLRSEFLNVVGLEHISSDNIRIIDTAYAWVNKL